MELSEQDKQRIEKEAKYWADSGFMFHIAPSLSEAYCRGAFNEHSHLSDLLSSQSKEIESLKAMIARTYQDGWSDQDVEYVSKLLPE